MITVKTVLKNKGHQIWSVEPESSVYEAIELMDRKGIGALLVREQANKLVGIITERDYLRKVILQGRSSKTTPVKDIMTGRVIGVGPEWTVDECMALMSQKHVRHLPVVDNNKLIGIVSIGDVVNGVINDKSVAIDHLERYILGL
jgi:CBS domain-containing protein